MCTNQQSLVFKYSISEVELGNHDYNIFVDAAFCDRSHSYATAFAVFDPDGQLKAVGFRKIRPTGSIMAAELQALHDGLIFGDRNFSGTKRIFFDSLEAIHLVYSKAKYIGVEELLIRNINTLISGSLVKRVWYCKRTNNTLAHNLAKNALISPHPRDWMVDDIPRHYKSNAPAL